MTISKLLSRKMYANLSRVMIRVRDKDVRQSSDLFSQETLSRGAASQIAKRASFRQLGLNGNDRPNQPSIREGDKIETLPGISARRNDRNAQFSVIRLEMLLAELETPDNIINSPERVRAAFKLVSAHDLFLVRDLFSALGNACRRELFTALDVDGRRNLFEALKDNSASRRGLFELLDAEGRAGLYAVANLNDLFQLLSPDGRKVMCRELGADKLFESLGDEGRYDLFAMLSEEGSDLIDNLSGPQYLKLLSSALSVYLQRSSEHTTFEACDLTPLFAAVLREFGRERFIKLLTPDDRVDFAAMIMREDPGLAQSIVRPE
jgi:hypothetical protein